MKILAIGDPHGDLEKIKKIPIRNVDLILLTGDLGKADLARKKFFENVERKQKSLPKKEYTKKEIKEVYDEVYDSSINILKYLSTFAPVYTILGNVGSSDAETRKDEKKYKIKLHYLISGINNLENVSLIKNGLRNINGLRIGFLEYFVDTSWIKEFQEKDKLIINKAKKESDNAKRVLKSFRNLDILLCHQPPYGFLDKVTSRYNPPKSWIGKHAGSKLILDYVRKYRPRYVLCGHIHEGEGKKKIGKIEIYNLGVAGHVLINID
ncbi:MAG: metallophosphoesterase [Candidatus Pacearchaeota archaeon]